MGIGSASLFEANRDSRSMDVNANSNWDGVPANDGPTMSAADLYRAETAGYGIANMETQQMNKGDLGFAANEFGSTMKEGATEILFGGALRDKSQDGPNADAEVELQQIQQQQLTASQSMRNFTLG